MDTRTSGIEQILTRGVAEVLPTREFLETQLQSGKQLTLYVGYDPTASSLHIGHGITLLKLRDFQQLGHKVIMLIGDFTAMIGDPTDKLATRTKLTREEVVENCKTYREQAAHILDFGGENPAELRFNNDWLGKLTFHDIIELSSHLTVQRLMERDMFEKRVEEGKPIHLHEFLYPLMQGYDSVAMDVDGEVGGTDQIFNMLTGRDLMKTLKHKEKFVMATKLLVDESGKKMSKTEGNMIALSDSPEDMFGKVMRFTDGMIVPGFELCTRIPMEEVHDIAKQMKTGVNPRDLKLRLAYEVTRQFSGEEAANKGREHFAAVIQHHEKPEDMPELKPSQYDVVTVLVEAGFVSSNSEARRAIDAGGVKINDTVADGYEAPVQQGDVVQKGKRFFVTIV
ncbi:MAG: tyrosine--tRNA ligase [Candidatus Magasanikbacteria bacterium RIFCSPHIGHO2_02_FULL_47_14]|uniref:Tyrosine--tRNA ligase n=1 Tax=Candidatus Magasanikbacteria bacterium RIFCSPHIGHO2_02_FULL_47_14 TaxID=1798680 RepID=A0A1F6M8F7_9BACT|nr:MAG: tyrosine--tRNA ligase [Candidatus Magasanikbacteria bacterium RIFCSPHIGHO2_02_FULL_47_14]